MTTGEREREGGGGDNNLLGDSRFETSFLYCCNY